MEPQLPLTIQYVKLTFPSCFLDCFHGLRLDCCGFKYDIVLRPLLLQFFNGTYWRISGTSFLCQRNNSSTIRISVMDRKRELICIFFCRFLKKNSVKLCITFRWKPTYPCAALGVLNVGTFFSLVGQIFHLVNLFLDQILNHTSTDGSIRFCYVQPLFTKVPQLKMWVTKQSRKTLKFDLCCAENILNK